MEPTKCYLLKPRKCSRGVRICEPPPFLLYRSLHYIAAERVHTAPHVHQEAWSQLAIKCAENPPSKENKNMGLRAKAPLVTNPSRHFSHDGANARGLAACQDRRRQL